MLSHVCGGCGTDLAGIAPRVEPAYGWSLVACPRCGEHHARREDPRVTAARTARHLGVSLGALTLNIAASVALLIIAAAACRGATFSLVFLGLPPSLIFSPSRFADALASLDRARAIEWLGSPEALLLVSFACASALAGAWVEAGLSHWPRARRWLAWTAGIVAVAWLIEFAGPLEMMFFSNQTMRPSARLVLGAAGDALRAQAPMALLSVVPAAAGGLIGRLMLTSLIRRRDQLRRFFRSRRAARLARSLPAHRKTHR